MNDRALPAIDPPATSTIRNVAVLLSGGSFAPASVQRSFEWEISYASQLLNDIDKVLARLHPEAETTIPADQDESEPKDNKADDNNAATSVAAPEDDFAFDEAAGEMAIGRAVGDDAPPTHYFIGNLILRASGPESHEIYDGLQRLTTLTILIAVLRDLMQDNATRVQLDHLITDRKQYRLRLFGRDKTLTEHVQASGATQLKSDNRAYHEIGRRILGVKNALRGQVEKWDEARRIRYARFLLSSVWASVLDVRDVRMARQMFVSTNLHGKHLEPVDLLKGQIADIISHSHAPEVADGFSKTWEDLKQVSGDAFAEMLRAVDAIERSDTQDKSWPTQLGGYLPTAYPGRDIERFVRRLKAYTYGWKECKRVLTHAGPSNIERDFWRLHIFWWPEWHGLALRWWNQVHLARKKGQANDGRWRALESKFRRLHRRCMGITLAQFEEADRQTIFMRALRQDKEGRDVFEGALSFNQNQRRKIDRTLRTQIHKEEIWAPLIRWIEIAEWRERLPELIRGTNTEHVRPRRPDLEDDQGENIRKYNEGCFSLGNLAVISRKGNKEAENRDFADKLAVLRNEARTFRTMHSVVYDAKAAERTQWTNAEINARADMLRQRVWELLGLSPPK